jgi:hypothetical protein
MIGFTTRFAGDPPTDDLTLAKGRGAWQRMLLVRCYSAVLLAVLPSFMPAARQGFCGEPDIGG